MCLLQSNSFGIGLFAGWPRPNNPPWPHTISSLSGKCVIHCCMHKYSLLQDGTHSIFPHIGEELCVQACVMNQRNCNNITYQTYHTFTSALNVKLGSVKKCFTEWPFRPFCIASNNNSDIYCITKMHQMLPQMLQVLNLIIPLASHLQYVASSALPALVNEMVSTDGVGEPW